MFVIIVIFYCKGCGALWLSAYIHNMFLECPELAQGLTFKQKWFDINFQHLLQILSHTGTLYLPLTPMGQKKNQLIFHIIHTLHGRLFLHISDLY